MNTDKKLSNKKINKTDPGKSSRICRNKPISERIGYNNDKSYKTNENFAKSYDRVSRNNKNGLKENARKATHGEDYEIPHRYTKSDCDSRHGLTMKMKHYDGLCRDLEAENVKNIDPAFVVEEVVWNLSPSYRSVEIKTYLIERATGNNIKIVDNMPIR
jgi:hypothetical protein